MERGGILLEAQAFGKYFFVSVGFLTQKGFRGVGMPTVFLDL